MTHFTSSRFWDCYAQLTEEIRAQADKKYALLKADPTHPSVRLKKAGPYWSARVSLNVRALAVQDGNDFVWFWIGDHHEYERIIGKR